jgi:hypothetical protein
MGVSGQRHAPAALLPPGKGPPVRIVQEAGWVPEPVWTQRLEEKSFNRPNKELHNLYSSSGIIRQVKSRRMRWAGHVARMGEDRKVYKVLVRKREAKRPLGRPRRRSKDGIRMDLRETGLGGVDWIRLSQDRDRWL